MRSRTRRRLTPRYDRSDIDALLADWLKEVGRRVGARRQLLGATRIDLADLAGTTEATITRVENGTVNASDRLRIAIAGVLCCEVADLWPYPTHERVRNMAEAVA